MIGINEEGSNKATKNGCDNQDYEFFAPNPVRPRPQDEVVKT